MEDVNLTGCEFIMDYKGGVPQVSPDEFYQSSRSPQQDVNQNCNYPHPTTQQAAVWLQQQSVMPTQQQELLRVEYQQQSKRHSHETKQQQQQEQQQQQPPKRQAQQEMKLQQIIQQQQQQLLSQQQKQRQQASLQDEESSPSLPSSGETDSSIARRKFSFGESTGERLSSIDERSTSCELEDEDESTVSENKVSEEEKEDSDREKTPTLPDLPDRELFKEFSYPGSETYIGFGNLTAQIQRIWRRKGFDFTLMVVGESGLGKSTLLENLFSVPMPNESDPQDVDDSPPHTTTISSRSALVTEGGLSLRLSLVDTPGFGAGLNCVGDAEPIANYLTSQLERYFLAESGLNRRELHDCLIHCCFFFLNPSTRGLKPLEIQCLKRLHHLVNVIPIIGKADTLTQQELEICKQRILQDLHSHGIRTYNIPESYPGEENAFCKQMEHIRESVPYAVIGGNSFLETSPGQRIRVRSYPWGTVDIENCEFSDFVKLRALVITHLEDMREKTHDIIYETYRAERLKSGHQSQRRFDETMKSMDDREKYLSRKEDELRRREREVRRVEEVMEVMYGENILKVDNAEKMKKQFRHSQQHPQQFDRK